MNDRAPVIRFEEVYKSFGPQEVLAGLTFAVDRGRTLAIMGPSGSGKSVALRQIIGLMKPDRGKVLVEGVEVAAMTPAELSRMRQKMGYVFQEGALINWLSVGDNIALPLRETTKLAEEEIRDRVQTKLDLVHIPDAWEKMPSEISGGMKKRVGLARALVTDPEIILYDEPNAGLDPEIARAINQTIRELAENLSVTSIVVEHRVDCIETVADEVIFLNQGSSLFPEPTETRAFLDSDHPRLKDFFGRNEKAELLARP